MMTREEIHKDLKGLNNADLIVKAAIAFQLDVLLDIRDLLQELSATPKGK